MAYIIQRKDRFDVVSYDGLDPLTGKERRRWHPAGQDRHEAEQMVARIERDTAGAAPEPRRPTHRVPRQDPRQSPLHRHRRGHHGRAGTVATAPLP